MTALDVLSQERRCLNSENACQSLAIGQVFSCELNEPSASGYLWALETACEGVEVTLERGLAAEPKERGPKDLPVGASGRVQVRVLGKAAGRSLVVLALRRPFLPDGEPEARISRCFDVHA